MRVMRALLFDSLAVPGGAERAVANLARALPDAGVACAAVVGEEGPLVAWLRADGCPVAVGVEEQLADQIAAWRPEVVLSIGARSHLVAAPVARAAGVPAIWWRELTPRGRPDELVAAALPTAVVACPTPAAVPGQRALMPETPIAVIAPGLDIDVISSRQAEGRRIRDQLGCADTPLVGMVARLDPAKGQDCFVDAAALVASEHPDVQFVLVGGAVVGHEDPDLAVRLDSRAAAAGLAHRLHLVGHVDDPIPWQAALDLAVNASTHESFGLSMLEAMALGVPVVATPTDGAAELLDDGRAGVLLESWTPDALARAVLHLLRSPRDRDELAERGARRARSYDVRATADAFAELFAEVTRSAAGAEPLLRAP
jgi:glycosyltransferase involved in cell wall biosynthesis